MFVKALRIVFKRPLYIFVSILVALSIAGITLLWTNLPLLLNMLSNDATSFGFVLTLAGKLLWGAPHSMGSLAVTMIIVNATLLGIIVSMLWYAWRKKYTKGSWRKLFGATGTGTLAALLGVGCIACGPLLVGSILAMFGAGGLLLLLPFHGAELGLLAVVLLGYALYTLAKLITAPAVCE